jgi:hypothetical protein
LSARGHSGPPNAVFLFHGALERLFPKKRETGSALLTDRTCALFVPAFRAAMDQDLVAGDAKIRSPWVSVPAFGASRRLRINRHRVRFVHFTTFELRFFAFARD